MAEVSMFTKYFAVLKIVSSYSLMKDTLQVVILEFSCDHNELLWYLWNAIKVHVYKSVWYYSLLVLNPQNFINSIHCCQILGMCIAFCLMNK